MNRCIVKILIGLSASPIVCPDAYFLSFFSSSRSELFPLNFLQNVECRSDRSHDSLIGRIGLHQLIYQIVSIVSFAYNIISKNHKIFEKYLSLIIFILL